jgi:ribosomal subunit interface protein
MLVYTTGNRETRMKVAISAHQFDLTAPLRQYAEQKLVDSIARLVDDSAPHLDIMLYTQDSAEGGMGCRVHLAVPNSTPIVVHRAANDMYAAIDMAHDTLLQQVHDAAHRSHDLHQVRREAQRHRAEVARHTLTAD